jgi:molybdopterin-binding protein
VLLASEEPRAISARNVLAGEVSAVIAESEQSRLVELITQSGIVLSRVTPEAVRDLSLAPGKKAWALAKAHTL